MKGLVITDLHLHSKYSRAVSQKMDLLEIGSWATKKGINLVTTSDWTHPLWFKELSTKLVEKQPGLYQLKKTDNFIDPNLRFILTTELSNIYTQNNKVHRIHTVVFSPSLEICAKVISKLKRQGVNLDSDGRPIMGLSMIELSELLWEIDENIFLIPAHIWTPWFSLYGSKSGFNSLNDCFGKYANKITAVETGLSSDPIMNWSVKELENRTLVSFSDAHSGIKLGREATVLKIKDTRKTYGYLDLIGAFKKDKKSNLEIDSTIEFFPQEGKYYASGHRNCNICLDPLEVKKNKGLCPKCHKPLTVGVADRAAELSSTLLFETNLPSKLSLTGVRLIYPPQFNRPPFASIVPLIEIIAQALRVGPQSKKVMTKYQFLISQFGSELKILLYQNLTNLEKNEPKIARAIYNMRQRRIQLSPGFDGVFGKINLNDAPRNI